MSRRDELPNLAALASENLDFRCTMQLQTVYMAQIRDRPDALMTGPLKGLGPYIVHGLKRTLRPMP